MNNEDKKCAPSKFHSDGSCFTLDQLKKMAISYNKFLEEKHFEGNEIIVDNNKRNLVLQLTNRLEKKCNDQLCWLKQKFVKALKDEDLFKNTFRPIGPEGRFDWLNTTQINEVMAQYEAKYPDFKFFGALPIDFDDLPFLNIRNIDFDNLSKKKKKLGFVFNLDEHWKSGSHWVALYSDLSKSQVYFFDSYGKRPEKRIRNLVKRISKWCHLNNKCKDSCSITDDSVSYMRRDLKNKIENEIDVEYNRNRHQYKNSECGVYSLNFILRLLNGNSFNEITESKVLDDEINECRDVYFRFNN